MQLTDVLKIPLHCFEDKLNGLLTNNLVKDSYFPLRTAIYFQTDVHITNVYCSTYSKPIKSTCMAKGI